MLATFLSGCTGAQREAERESRNKLTFMDSAIFDKNLSRAMRAEEEEIEVLGLVKFTPNNIPERLDKWFYVIDENGGEVEAVRLSPRNQGIFGEIIIHIIIRAYENIRQKILYGPAKNYNATLYCRPDEGAVEKIIFSHKKTDAGRGKVEEAPGQKQRRGPAEKRRRWPDETPKKSPTEKSPISDDGFLGDLL